MLETLDAWRLWECIDFSWDIAFANRLEFLDALGELHRACTDEFKQSVHEYGIVTPILICVHQNGEWSISNGHHRLAIALFCSLPLPVLFCIDDDGGDDLDFMASYDNDWPDSY